MADQNPTQELQTAREHLAELTTPDSSELVVNKTAMDDEKNLAWWRR